MEPTREQLQAEILEILYQKCLQKPIWVSCAEIFWSISNLKVSERSVKDVLDWLVKTTLSFIKQINTRLPSANLWIYQDARPLRKRDRRKCRSPDCGVWNIHTASHDESSSMA